MRWLLVLTDSVALEKGTFILQAELPVSGSVAVPIGQRHHHALEPWPLDDEVCERWLRHDVGGVNVRAV